MDWELAEVKGHAAHFGYPSHSPTQHHTWHAGGTQINSCSILKSNPLSLEVKAFCSPVRIPNSAESIFLFLATRGAQLNKTITHFTSGGHSSVQWGQPHVVLGIYTSSWNQTAQVRGIRQSGKVLLMLCQMLCILHYHSPGTITTFHFVFFFLSVTCFLATKQEETSSIVEGSRSGADDFTRIG